MRKAKAICSERAIAKEQDNVTGFGKDSKAGREGKLCRGNRESPGVSCLEGCHGLTRSGVSYVFG